MQVEVFDYFFAHVLENVPLGKDIVFGQNFTRGDQDSFVLDRFA